MIVAAIKIYYFSYKFSPKLLIFFNLYYCNIEKKIYQINEQTNNPRAKKNLFGGETLFIGNANVCM